MVAKAHGERREHRVEIALAAAAPPLDREVHDDGGQRAGKRIDLGPDGLRPQQPSKGEPQRNRRGGRETASGPAKREEAHRHRRRSEEGGHHVDPPGQHADRQLREDERDEHVERIPRRMRRPEDAADVLELGRIAAAAEAGKERP